MTTAPGLAPAGPARWRGAELTRRNDFAVTLGAEEVEDLELALAHAKTTGRPMKEWAREDFPLPVLGPGIAAWMRELQHGRGFVNVKGLPVERHDLADVERLYWGLGLHMGTAVSQNAAGDLLGHVRDTGADPTDPSIRLYKTRVALAFHSDGSDLVGLLCIRQGIAGGETALVSTATLFTEFRARRPDLVPVLFQPFHWDRNDEQAPGEPPSFALPICSERDGKLSLFYIGWYIRGAQRHPSVPRLTDDQHAALDLIDAIASDPELHLRVRLEPGEINFLKNNAVLHSRTAYEDSPDPAVKRHMLRLWLTAHGEWADGDDFVRQGIPAKDGVTSDAAALRS